MTTNRINRQFADGLRLLLAHKTPAIQNDIPHFFKRQFRVGDESDLLRALEHVDRDIETSKTTVKSWFEARHRPRGRNRRALIILLGPLAELLLNGEDISAHIRPQAEASEAVESYWEGSQKEELRQGVQEATDALYVALGRLNDLRDRLE